MPHIEGLAAVADEEDLVNDEISENENNSED